MKICASATLRIDLDLQRHLVVVRRPLLGVDVHLHPDLGLRLGRDPLLRRDVLEGEVAHVLGQDLQPRLRRRGCRRVRRPAPFVSSAIVCLPLVSVGRGLARTSDQPQRASARPGQDCGRVHPELPRRAAAARILDHLVVRLDRLGPCPRPRPPVHIGRGPHRHPRGAPADQQRRAPAGRAAAGPRVSVKNPGRTSSTPATRISAPCAIGPPGSCAGLQARPQPVQRPHPLPAHQRRPE